MTPSAPKRATSRHLTVGHLVANYLPLTENWMHTLACSVPGATPVILNRGRRIDDRSFPVAEAHHLDDLTPRSCRLEADTWETRGYSRTLRHAASRAGCDLLHAHFGTEGAMYVELADSLRLPLVTSFYGYDVGVLPRDPAWRSSLARLFDRGTLFLAEGPAMAETLVGLGCPDDRIRVAPLPVTVKAGRRPARDPTDPLILVCGRLVDKKGVDDSLRALAALKDERRTSFRCLVVGDGPERPKLEQLVRELGLGTVVSMTGSVPLPRLHQLLDSATVVLQMSRTARDGDCEGGAPVVLAEAQARGVPVVATRHCDIPTTIAHGGSGWIVEPGDTHDAAARLESLIANPDAARRFGRQGRQRMATGRSVEVCGARLRQHYVESLERRRTPRPGRRSGVAVPPTVALLVDLRRRARDVDGLARLERRIGATDPSRPTVLQGLAEALDGQGDHLAAARAYRRWGREFPGESYAALHEARCLLAGGSSGRASEPLCRFLDAHPSPLYAAHVAAELLSALPAGAGLLGRALRRAAPPIERLPLLVQHLRATVDRSDPSSGPRLTRELTAIVRTDVVPMLTPSRKRAARRDLPPVIEHALAELLILSVRLGHAGTRTQLLRLIPIHQLRTGLPIYRVASLLKDGSHRDRTAAKALFTTLARRASLPVDLRSGACYHLARLASAENRRRSGLAYGRRCLALDASHVGARTLVRELERP